MNNWATAIVSALVLVVAFMQWRTAHLKVVLDLFDRRMGVYSELEQAMAMFLVSDGRELEAVQRARRAFLDAKFLFGPDVFSRINGVMNALRAFENIPLEVRMYEAESEKLANMRRSNQVARDETELFLRDMPVIFERYLRMEQKLIRTPWQWFAARNAMRLSYGDDHVGRLETPRTDNQTDHS